MNCFYTSFWLDENESDDYVSNDSSITSENVNNSSENDDDKINPYGDEIKKWSREKLLKFCTDNKLISKPLRFDVYTNDKIIYWIQRWYSGYNLELEMDLDLRNFELFQLREYCNFLSIDFNNSKNELEIACMIANINRKNTSFSFLYFLTNNELKKICKFNELSNYQNLDHKALIDLIIDNELDSSSLKEYDLELPWFDKKNNKNNTILTGSFDLKGFQKNIDDIKKNIEMLKNLSKDNDKTSSILDNNLSSNKNLNSKELTSSILQDEIKITFKDIAGLESVKKAFEEKVILPIKHAELFKNFKKKIGGGILLFGLPGTGKTLFAEAVANEIEASYFSVKCSDIKSKWVGESEANIKNLFEKARKTKRAIIFMDEFESLGRKRTDDDLESKNIVPEILAQMQGVKTNNTNILVIAATNRPWDIDSALLRPGRFDEKIYVPLPDFLARKEIFKIKLKDIPIENLDFDYLAKITKNFNGADIDYFCEKLKLSAIKRSIKEQKQQKISKIDLDIVKPKMKSSVNLKDQKEMEEFLNQYYV